MNELRRPGAVASLAVGHFLFLSSLYWTGGVHSGNQDTFLGARSLELPYFSQSGFQAVIYLLGLICVALIVTDRQGTKKVWPVPALIGLVSVEVYICLLDVRLAGRFWCLICLLTIAYIIGKEPLLKRGFWIIPASGPWGYAAFLFLLPLLWVRIDRKFVAGVAFLLFAQGRFDTDLDLTIFAGTLLLTLFPPTDSEPEPRKWVALCGLLCLLATAGTRGLWSPVKVQVSFMVEARRHTLVVERRGKVVRVWGDGMPLSGAWYLNGQVAANPLFFALFPQRVSSARFYEAYGHELKSRLGAGEFRYRFENL